MYNPINQHNFCTYKNTTLAFHSKISAIYTTGIYKEENKGYLQKARKL
jgi:hypothetical protein